MSALGEIRLDRGTMSPPRSLLFVHIPKTAGTTFQTILSRVYGRVEQCAIYPNWETIRPVVIDHPWKRTIRVVGGHFPYGLHADPELRPLLSEEVDYITFLRDPVARVVSHFNHVMNGECSDHQEVFAQHPTIEKFLEHEWARDLQTRHLAGFENPIDGNPRGAVRAARAVLRDRFEVVGIAERFDESLILCAEAFGWNPPTYAAENRAVDRARKLRVKDLNKSLIARIRAVNRCDVAVYEYAKTLFDRRCARTPRFAEKLSAYRARFVSAAAVA